MQNAFDEAHTHVPADLAAKHNISLERAEMLVDRYGIVRHTREGAAQALRVRKV